MPIFQGAERIKSVYYAGSKISEAYFGSDLVYRSGPQYQTIIDALEAEPNVDKWQFDSSGELLINTSTMPQYYKKASYIKDVIGLNIAFILSPGDSFTLLYDASGTRNDGGVSIHHDGNAVVLDATGGGGKYYWGEQVTHTTTGPALIVVTILGVSVNNSFYHANNLLTAYVMKWVTTKLSGNVSSDLYFRAVINGDYGVQNGKSPTDSYYKGGVFKVPIDLAGELLA